VAPEDASTESSRIVGEKECGMSFSFLCALVPLAIPNTCVCTISALLGDFRFLYVLEIVFINSF